MLKAYYTSWREETRFLISTSELLLRGLIYSFPIHAMAVVFITLCGYEVQLQVIYDAISGKEISLSQEQWVTYLLQFCVYEIAIILLVITATKKFKSWIKNNNYDIDIPFWKTANYWTNIFSARVLEKYGVQGTRDETDLILIDVLTKKDIIYTGILRDYNFVNDKDELECIILSQAVKRTFKKEDEDPHPKRTTGKPLPVNGDALIIPMQEVVNMNIQFVSLEKKTTDEAV